MIRSLALAAAVALLAGPARGQDGEAYTIKVKKAGEGDTVRAERTESGAQHVKVADLKGNVLNEEDKKAEKKFVFTETILSKKPGERATRLKRKYEKAEQTADGETTTLPFQGKTVLIEKKGGKFVFRVEGGDELTGDDAKALNEEFNKKGKLDEAAIEKLFLPQQAVKVGETWKIDPAAVNKGLAEGAGLQVYGDKTAGTGKLKRVYKKGGRQFGVIALHVQLAPKSVSEKGKTMQVEPGGKMTLDIDLDICIDGSSSGGTARFNVAFSMEVLYPSPDEPMARVTVNGKETGTQKEIPQ
jgi:hypothetical protein